MNVNGHEAQRILNDPAFSAALELIERRAIEDMLAAHRTWLPWVRRKRDHAANVVAVIRELRGLLHSAIAAEHAKTRRGSGVA
jgi:hypothetical protein